MTSHEPVTKKRKGPGPGPKTPTITIKGWLSSVWNRQVTQMDGDLRNEMELNITWFGKDMSAVLAGDTLGIICPGKQLRKLTEQEYRKYRRKDERLLAFVREELPSIQWWPVGERMPAKPWSTSDVLWQGREEELEAEYIRIYFYPKRRNLLSVTKKHFFETYVREGLMALQKVLPIHFTQVDVAPIHQRPRYFLINGTAWFAIDNIELCRILLQMQFLPQDCMAIICMMLWEESVYDYDDKSPMYVTKTFSQWVSSTDDACVPL
jgi:hypothetical protein